MTFRLFAEADLGSFLTGRQHKWSEEIDSLSESRILNTSPEDLCSNFVKKYGVEPLVLDESAIQVDYGDARVDVSRRFEYGIIDKRGPYYITGTRFVFYVPFEGNVDLFKCRPSTFTLSSPRANVRGNELVFVYEGTTHDAQGVKEQFDRDLGSVQENLGWIASDVDRFNATIHQNVNDQIGNYIPKWRI